jgi:hypothetical protein
LFKELDELEKLIWKYYEGEGLEDYCEKYSHVEDKHKGDEENSNASNTKHSENCKIEETHSDQKIEENSTKK